MDADERRKMGLNGHNAVVNNYTYEKIAENYTKLFPAKENLHILMIQHYAGSNSMGMVFLTLLSCTRVGKTGIQG